MDQSGRFLVVVWKMHIYLGSGESKEQSKGDDKILLKIQLF